MENTIIGLVVIVAGCIMIILRKQFAQGNIKFQNKIFGFHFKERPKADAALVGVVGLIILFFGMLVVFRQWLSS